jgi:hypothetical protein
VSKEDDDIERALGDFFGRQFGKFGTAKKPRQPKPGPAPTQGGGAFRTSGSWYENGDTFSVSWRGVGGVIELDGGKNAIVDEETLASAAVYGRGTVLMNDGRIAEFDIPWREAKGGPDPNAFREVKPRTFREAEEAAKQPAKIVSPFDLFPDKPKWLFWYKDKPWCLNCMKSVPAATITVGEQSFLDHFSNYGGVRRLDYRTLGDAEYILDVECHGEFYRISSARGVLEERLTKGGEA